MRWGGPALAALLLVFGCASERQGAPSAAPPTEPTSIEPERDAVSSQRLARFFDELAYGNAAAPEGTSPTLLRWTDRSLTYAIAGPAPPDAQRRIADRLAHFRALTGVAVAPGNGADATIVFEFVRGTRVPVRDEFAACSARTTYDERGIRRARIFIATDPPRTFAACLDHELMHAYGFPHHSSVLPSVMGPIRWSDTLSEADEAVLRALYDKRLSVGFTREQAAPILTQILDEAGRARPISSRQPGANLEWHTIKPDETALAFDPPGFELSIRRNFWAVPSSGAYLVEISFLSAPEQEWPRAGVRYVRLGSGRSFSRFVSPEEIARSWPTVGEISPHFRPAAERQTSLGAMRYAIADTAAGPCLVFLGEFGGQHPARIDGFYCAARGREVNVAAILDSLSVREPRYRPQGVASAD